MHPGAANIDTARRTDPVVLNDVRAVLDSLIGPDNYLSRGTQRLYTQIYCSWLFWSRGRLLVTAEQYSGELTKYLNQLTAEGKSTETLQSVLTALKYFNRIGLSQYGPGKEHQVMIAAHRIRRRPRTKKITLLSVEGADKVLKTIALNTPLRPADYRDTALFRLISGYCLTLKEVKLLEIKDIVPIHQGYQLLLGDRSPPLDTLTYQSLITWIRVAGISSGRVFRSISRNSTPGAAISDRGILLIIQRRTAAAGYTGRYTVNSIRYGAAQSMLHKGVSHNDIKQILGVKKLPVQVAHNDPPPPIQVT